MPDAWLEKLPPETCLRLLREHAVGRIAVLVDTFPVVWPVNYRLVETSGRTWLAIRTRPGGVVDRAPFHVAFEIDGIDPVRKQGWSVLVRGTLLHVDPDAAGFGERFDPHPWLLAERDAWVVIEPFAITGRQLHPEQIEWLFVTREHP